MERSRWGERRPDGGREHGRTMPFTPRGSVPPVAACAAHFALTLVVSTPAKGGTVRPIAAAFEGSVAHAAANSV